VAGVKRNDEEDLASSAQDDPLWSRVADGSSGVRLKRPDTQQQRGLLSGQYRLLEPIGASSYGRAFVAEHVPQKRRVAVHFLPRDANSERVLSRALPLAVAKCAQLSHPNVVGVEAYGRSEQEGLYYVVTAPLEGVSLADYLRDSGPLSVKDALGLMRQIGRALRAAHKLGIVHGDIRPANVRIVDTPSGPLAKVVGFGKAVLLSRESEPTSEVRGIISPVYAAPELYHSGIVDPRSDVYSLGAMLFRLIAGEPPYPGGTPLAVMNGHVAMRIPSLRERAGEHVPVEIDELVMRCLQKEPEQRFPDVVAFMQAMRLSMVDDSDFLSRDASDFLSLPPGVNSILPSVPTALSADAEVEQPAARPEATRNNSWLWIVLGGLLFVAVVGEIWWETQGEQSFSGKVEKPEKR
jgi:serine/threonine protein kinase